MTTCTECGKELTTEAEAIQHEEWHARKADGAAVAAMLAPLPEGATFKLRDGGRAYSAIYRKNGEGSWDQVFAAEMPLVRNMSADHLGFCVGISAVQAGLDAGVTS